MVSLSTTRRNSGVASLVAHGYCAEHADTAIARAAFLEPPGSAKQEREYPTQHPGAACHRAFSCRGNVTSALQKRPHTGDRFVLSRTPASH